MLHFTIHSNRYQQRTGLWMTLVFLLLMLGGLFYSLEEAPPYTGPRPLLEEAE